MGLPRRDSDFQVVSETIPEDRPPSHSEVPLRLHTVEKAFDAHRSNQKRDDEEFERWKDDKLEPRLRALEDHRLSSTTYVVAAGAVIGVIFTSTVAVLGLLSGILKWNL